MGIVKEEAAKVVELITAVLDAKNGDYTEIETEFEALTLYLEGLTAEDTWVHKLLAWIVEIFEDYETKSGRFWLYLQVAKKIIQVAALIGVF